MKTVNKFIFIKPSYQTIKNVNDKLGGWGPLNSKEKKFFEDWCNIYNIISFYFDDLTKRKLLAIAKSNDYDIISGDKYPSCYKHFIDIGYDGFVVTNGDIIQTLFFRKKNI